MTVSSEREPTGSHPCVYTPRPTVAYAAPVVVIILVILQTFTQVEFSLILGR